MGINFSNHMYVLFFVSPAGLRMLELAETDKTHDPTDTD